MQFTIKLNEADVTFKFISVNKSNPKMAFLMFQSDQISVESLGDLPVNHDPNNAAYIRNLHVQFCKVVAAAISTSLRELGLSPHLLPLEKDNVGVTAEDESTKIPTQFAIYFPQTMQQELEKVLAPKAPRTEPVETTRLPVSPAPDSTLSVVNDAQQPPLLPTQPPPPRASRLRVQDPLPLQNPDLFNGIKDFEDLFNKHLTIEGQGDDRYYARNRHYGIDVKNLTVISNFFKQHLVANIKPLLEPKVESLVTPGKKTNKIANFSKYTADLDQAVKEVWDSLMAKLLVVEELRLELVAKRKGLAAPDQDENIINLTQKMQSKENEIIFIIEAYKTMFAAIKQADSGPQEQVYESKFKAIETCQDTLVKLGWKGRLFIGFCTLIGVLIGAAAGFFLGANGGVIAGAAAGTLLFPVPIVGTVKGAIVGGTVTGVWAAIKAGGIGGAIGSGVGAALMGLGSFGLSWYTANRTYSMDSANLHFFSACNKLVKHAQWFEEPTPDPNSRVATFAKMSGST